MDRLAIVILNWNGCGMLRRYLPTLERCSAMEGVSIVVADNNSTDGSMEMMRAEFPAIRLIQLDDNYGFAGGYNMALKQVGSEYYLLLNSDVEVTDGWLEPMLEYMDIHPEVAACQPKIRDFKKPEMFEYAGAAGGYMDKWGYMFCRGRIFDCVEKDEGQYDDVRSVFWATGAALLVRSRDFWNAGGLDERFFAHQEEIDLCWRLRSRGHGIVCIPESTVFHVGGATLNKSNPYKTFLNFRNNPLMLYKNLPENRLRRVMFVRFWLDMLAMLMFVVKLNMKDAGAVLRARREFRRLKPAFAQSRRENLAASTVTDIPECADFSILWKYHIGGKRRFSDIGELTDYKN